MKSSLVNYTKLSHNYNIKDKKISQITILYMTGSLIVEPCSNVFVLSTREVSVNYGIRSDDRSWVSANRENVKKVCFFRYYVFNSSGTIICPVASNLQIDYAQNFDLAKAGRYVVILSVGSHLRTGTDADKRNLEMLGQGNIILHKNGFLSKHLRVEQLKII